MFCINIGVLYKYLMKRIFQLNQNNVMILQREFYVKEINQTNDYFSLGT